MEPAVVVVVPDVPEFPVAGAVVEGGATVVVVLVGGVLGLGISNTMLLVVPDTSVWPAGGEMVTVSVTRCPWGASSAGMGAS